MCGLSGINFEKKCYGNEKLKKQYFWLKKSYNSLLKLTNENLTFSELSLAKSCYHSAVLLGLVKWNELQLDTQEMFGLHSKIGIGIGIINPNINMGLSQSSLHIWFGSGLDFITLIN